MEKEKKIYYPDYIEEPNMTKEEIDKIMSEVESLVSKKEWKFLNGYTRILDNSSEGYYEKGYKNDEYVIIKSGYIGGQPRAIGFNIITKKIQPIT